MSYIINRTPPARIRCLYYLLQFIYHKFSENEFSMGELLFDKDKDNIHNFCKILKYDESLGIKYCPYLQNPLSEAGCYLTRGVKDDSTKRKEISNSINSLDALGFIDREEGRISITEFGKSFTEIEFNSPEWLKTIRKAICNYGLSVGLLWQIKNQGSKNINSRALISGYPNTSERLQGNGEMVKISSGSQADSNTRTKSCILAWFVTTGFILPNSISGIKNPDKIHLETDDYITNKIIRNETYRKIFVPDIFSGNFLVLKPLNYDNLTKDIRALRENGQKASRELTMKYEHIIKNRRFAILYCLNFASKNKRLLDFKGLKSELKKYPKFFVIDDKNFNEVIDTELQIALISGIPFETEKNGFLKPTTLLNLNVLCYNAPKKLIDLLNEKIVKKYALPISK